MRLQPFRVGLLLPSTHLSVTSLNEFRKGDADIVGIAAVAAARRSRKVSTSAARPDHRPGIR